MSLIHVLTKEKECFSATVAMAANNLSSYIGLMAIIYQERRTKNPKIRIINLKLFLKNKEVVF
jgi:hypothetical protein